MAQQAIAQVTDPTTSRLDLRTKVNTQLEAVDENFDELYAAVALRAFTLRPETAAGTTQELSLAALTGTTLTNNLQDPATDVSLTIAAPIVAGMLWDMVIAVTLNSGKFWKLTLPLGASFLFNGVMGINGGSVTFTAPARGVVATCRAITINTGVVVILETADDSVTVV